MFVASTFREHGNLAPPQTSSSPKPLVFLASVGHTGTKVRIDFLIISYFVYICHYYWVSLVTLPKSHFRELFLHRGPLSFSLAVVKEDAAHAL